MTTIFETAGKKFSIKENQSSWTVKLLDTSNKIDVSLKYLKVNYPKIEEVKNEISKMCKGD